MELLVGLQSVWAEPLGEESGLELTSEPRKVRAAWCARPMHIALVSIEKSPKGRHAVGDSLREQALRPEAQAGQAAGVLMVGGVTGACLIGAKAAVDEWQAMYEQGARPTTPSQRRSGGAAEGGREAGMGRSSIEMEYGPSDDDDDEEDEEEDAGEGGEATPSAAQLRLKERMRQSREEGLLSPRARGEPRAGTPCTRLGLGNQSKT